MLELNSTHNLRILEKYLTDMFIDIHNDNSKILCDKDKISARNAIVIFINDQIKRIKEQIAEKENKQ